MLKAHDLITSPAFIVMKAANEFKDKTTAINQLWQTDFTYLKVIGWGWFYLSHDPRRLLALHHRLEAVHDDEGRATSPTRWIWRSRLQAVIRHGFVHKPRLLQRQWFRVTSRAIWLNGWTITGNGPRPRRAVPSPDPRQDRALASDLEEPHLAGKLLSCLAISKPSIDSFVEPITTTNVITRASKTSRRPTSTSGVVKPFCWNEKGSNETQSKNDACNIKNKAA